MIYLFLFSPFAGAGIFRRLLAIENIVLFHHFINLRPRIGVHCLIETFTFYGRDVRRRKICCRLSGSQKDSVWPSNSSSRRFTA